MMDPCVSAAGVVVAVDGPSGSGKSTVSRRLAQALGARYLDTGAMYRAVTLAVLQADVDPADADTVTKIAVEADLQLGTDPAAPHTTLDGINVDAPIRGRRGHGRRLRRLGGAGGTRPSGGPAAPDHRLVPAGPGIVVEGRDIGAVVAPDADLKVYLTASAAERARRRSTEHAADLDGHRGRPGAPRPARLDPGRRPAGPGAGRGRARLDRARHRRGRVPPGVPVARADASMSSIDESEFEPDPLRRARPQ